MSTIEKDKLVPIPYVIGEFINEPYKTSDFLILLPPSQQLVSIQSAVGFIHDDYCDGECDEDCEDGFWREEPEDDISWMIDFPWSLMRISIFYSGLQINGERSQIEACPTHIWSCVGVPTKDVGETLIYRMPLPNTYEDARICLGNSYIRNDPKGSFSQVIIDCINQFWQSPYNRDLTNIEDLEELLTNWEKDPNNAIASFINESQNKDILWKLSDICNETKINIISPISIFRNEFITKGNIGTILSGSLEKKKEEISA